MTTGSKTTKTGTATTRGVVVIEHGVHRQTPSIAAAVRRKSIAHHDPTVTEAKIIDAVIALDRLVEMKSMMMMRHMLMVRKTRTAALHAKIGAGTRIDVTARATGSAKETARTGKSGSVITIMSARRTALVTKTRSVSAAATAKLKKTSATMMMTSTALHAVAARIGTVSDATTMTMTDASTTSVSELTSPHNPRRRKMLLAR